MATSQQDWSGIDPKLKDDTYTLSFFMSQFYLNLTETGIKIKIVLCYGVLQLEAQESDTRESITHVSAPKKLNLKTTFKEISLFAVCRKSGTRHSRKVQNKVIGPTP